MKIATNEYAVEIAQRLYEKFVEITTSEKPVEKIEGCFIIFWGKEEHKFSVDTGIEYLKTNMPEEVFEAITNLLKQLEEGN
jgi:hypothetical protein